jgi:hypothetical protein
MVSGNTINVGDTVKDRKLGQVWTVVGYDLDGILIIERNRVMASASFWDLELVAVSVGQIRGVRRLADL